MPKATKRQKPTRLTANTKPFVPGYYCPECLDPVPNISGAARPPIWHEECKPKSGTPASRKRICPGCGKKRERDPGNSSAYCGPACKARYVAHLDENKGQRRAKDCIVPSCKEWAYNSDTGRRYSLCYEHAGYFSELRAATTAEDITRKIYTVDEALQKVIDGWESPLKGVSR